MEKVRLCQPCLMTT
uniref:Uncharacterized protein n=1 Tax=Arundo donax TaxID=35708 RepID=A0A0A8YCZ5_ARUDO